MTKNSDPKVSDFAPPKPGKMDMAVSLTKGAISVGGAIFGVSTDPIASVMDFFASPLAKRQYQWALKVCEALDDLTTDRGVRVEDLQDDPAFIDAVYAASRAAAATSQEEKLNALRNVVINAGLPNAPDQDRLAFLIGMIERFTASHIHLLRYAHYRTRLARLDGQRPLFIPSDFDKRPPEALARAMLVLRVEEAMASIIAAIPSKLQAVLLRQMDTDDIIEWADRVSEQQPFRGAEITELGDELWALISAPA